MPRPPATSVLLTASHRKVACSVFVSSVPLSPCWRRFSKRFSPLPFRRNTPPSPLRDLLDVLRGARLLDQVDDRRLDHLSRRFALETERVGTLLERRHDRPAR